MTSTTLKPKSNLGTAFSKVFKQSLLNFLLALGASIFVAVIAIIIVIDDNSGYALTLGYEINLNAEASIVIGVVSVITGFFSLSIAPKMFKEIYKKQSCDFYFATPIKREEYFVANYLFGLMSNAICFIVSGGLFNTVMTLASNKYNIYLIDYKAYFDVTIPIFLAVIAIYSAFVMCAVISGRRIHYVLLSMICLLCTSTITGGAVARINSIWGAYVSAIIPSSISPAENAMISMFTYEKKYAAMLCIISAVEIAGMFAAGFIAFKRRKAEVAEVTLSGKVIPYILLAVLCAAAYMYSTFNNGFIAILVGIVLAVLMAIAFSGIFYKKVFTRQIGITTACVCIACTVFTALVYFPMHNSYVKYVPEASEVKSVEISNTYNIGEFAGIISLLNNNGFFSEIDGTVIIESEQGIADAIELHKKCFDDAVMEKSKQHNKATVFDYIFDEYSYIGDMTFDYMITYHLNNGRTVQRCYSVVSGSVVDECAKLAQSEEVLMQTDPFNIDSSMLAAVDGYVYDDEELIYDDDMEYYEKDTTISLNLKNFDFDKFKECYMKDKLSLNKQDFVEDNLIFGQYMQVNKDAENYYTEDYVDTYLANINLYYITKDATAEDIERIKKMSNQEAINEYEKSFSGTEDDYLIEISMISISENDKETIKYLESCGVKFNK